MFTRAAYAELYHNETLYNLPTVTDTSTESQIVPYSLVCETDAFKQKLEKAQSQALLTIKSHETGADREQWFLQWQEQLLVVCVEHLSESAWIEPMGHVSQERLQNFYKQLICY